MADRILDMSAIEKKMEIEMRRANKDTTAHHIHSKPLTDILQAADQLPDCDRATFVNDLILESEDFERRLRHRAAMMRERANEFDKIADLLVQKQTPSMRGMIESYEEVITNIIQLLKSHAHVEPQGIKP